MLSVSPAKKIPRLTKRGVLMVRLLFWNSGKTSASLSWLPGSVIVRGWVKNMLFFFFFFFSTGIMTYTGTCIIHQNEAGLLWITSLFLDIVTISLNSNVSPSNESMYPCLVKFCQLFFELLHHCSFHFLVIGMMFAS